MASVLLQQDIELSELSGVHLKWTIAGLTAPIHEIALVYIKKSGSDSINSVIINPTLTKYSLLGLEAGVAYLFQLQVTDSASPRVTIYSDSIEITAPYIMDAPVIDSVSGLDNALQVTLASSANVFVAGDTVEFLLRKNETVMFWVVKPFSAGLVYTLSQADDARISNTNTYRVACMFQPDDASIYRSASAVSNTMSGEPSNRPNIPRSIVLSAVYPPAYGLQLDWDYPDDYSEWSSNFTLYAQYRPVGAPLWSNIIPPSPMNTVRTLAFSPSVQGSYECKVWYANRFGEGTQGTSGSAITYSLPDAPTITNVVVGDQQADVYINVGADNGRALQNVRVLVGGLAVKTDSYATFLANGGKITVTGLNNGVSYSFTAITQNLAGWSSASDPSPAVIPFGQPSMSAVKSGQTVTVSYTPNGKIITKLFVIAVDADVSSDESIFQDVDVSPYTALTGVINIPVTFSDLSGPITKYVVVSTNEFTSLDFVRWT